MIFYNSLNKLSAPVAVNLEVTDLCNFKCEFCCNDSPNYIASLQNYNTDSTGKNLLSVNSLDSLYKLRSIVDILYDSDIFEIRLFGGEFTVFKYWRELVEYIAKKNFFISFVSNGYLLNNKDDIKFLIDCGVRECNISLHGLEINHDKITNFKGSYSRIVENIHLLQKLGIVVTVIFTPFSKNINDLYFFIKTLNKKHGVKSFGVNRLFHSDRYENLDTSTYLYLLEVINKCNIELDIEIKFIDSFPRCKIPLNRWKYLSYCSQGVSFGQIDFNGNIKSCSASSYQLGNIFENDIKEIWGSQLKSLRMLEHLPLSCKLCPIFCGGGCMASRDDFSIFSPDEFINLPFQESILSSIIIILKNYIKKYIYFLSTKFQKNIKSDYSEVNESYIPQMKNRFKIRAENQFHYIVMFEFAGIYLITELGYNILKLINGNRNISLIYKECNKIGLSCTIREIKEIVNDFISLDRTSS